MVNHVYKFSENLIRLECVDSTNIEAFRRAQTRSGFRLAVTSLMQTAGKGRLGRSFLSEKSMGLFLSLLENEVIQPQITARTAVTVTRVLEKLTGLDLKIKWPNDIICSGKKLCGILTEMKGNNIVIGIGINLYNEDFKELGDIATSLRLCGCEIEREVLLSELLTAFDNLFDGYEQSKQSDLEFYKSHSCVIGRDIYLIKNNEKIPAKAVGLGEDFGLKIICDYGEAFELLSGEISLRLR